VAKSASNIQSFVLNDVNIRNKPTTQRSVDPAFAQFCAGDKPRRMRWAGHVARLGEERGVYRVLVGKPEGKRPLGRPRHRWEDNIRMDLQEVGCGGIDWIQLAQDRDRWRAIVNAVMNLRGPLTCREFLH
jgi:hypothetical protein